jgi:hypothetical protein
MVPFSSTWDANDVLVIMSTVGATTAGATTTAAASAATITTTTTGTVSDWRQYVPLGVSIAVIMDILLGSPFANAIVSRMRPTTTKTTTMDPEIDDASDLSRPRRQQQQQQQQQQSKERIDSQKVAQDAIQRAQYTLELRSFLDAKRDPVVELQRRMEEQTRQLEHNQAQLQSQIIQERSNSINSDNDKK